MPTRIMLHRPTGDNSAIDHLERARLVILLGLATLVRAYYVSFPRVVWGDEPGYLWLGQSLWAGDGYNIFGFSGAHFPPLVPTLVGGLARLVGDLKLGSDLLYVIAGALLVLPLYGIARRLYSQRAALATGLIAAVYPALTVGVLTWGTMTEALYLLLIGTTLYMLVVALESGRRRDYLRVALALGLAYLTRTEALVLVVVSLGLLAIVRLARRDRLITVVISTGLALALVLLMASPSVIYRYNSTGDWALTGNAGMAYVSMDGLTKNSLAAFDKATWGLDRVSGEVYYFAPASREESLVAAILADPGNFLARARANTKELLVLLFGPNLIPWPIAALAILGLFSHGWDTRRLRGELALLASLVAPLSYVPFFVQDRYLAGALIPTILWAGMGCAHLGNWLITTWRTVSGRTPGIVVRLATSLPTLLVAVALLWLGPRLWYARQITNSFQPAHVAAAILLENAGATAEDVVMSRYPAIAFHAGTRWTPTPVTVWPEVRAYAQRHSVDYLVLDEWEANLRPQLATLLTPNTAPASLKYLGTLDGGAGPVVVYAFESTP
jgi:4-amino-4-deoxy-L-arabinose transferase-like glycosyltransferase